MTTEPVVTDARVMKSTMPRARNEPERVRLLLTFSRDLQADEVDLATTLLSEKLRVTRDDVAAANDQVAAEIRADAAVEDARLVRDIIAGLPERIRQRQVREAQEDAQLRSIERDVRDALDLR